MTDPRPDQYDEDVIFKYHRPDSADAEKFVAIRDKAGEFAQMLRQLCPPGRELALARTNLEQSVMWANAGIARAPARRAKKGA